MESADPPAYCGPGTWTVEESDARPARRNPGSAGLRRGLALLLLLLRGRERIYTGAVTSLIHLSPAPAQAVVLSEVVGALPQRVWTALLLTLALYPASRLAGLRVSAALMAAALAGGLLGHLTGMVFLLSLVRRWPGALIALPAAGMLLSLGMVGFIAYLLTAGVWQVGAAQVGAVTLQGGWVRTGELVLLLLLSLAGFTILFGPVRRWSGEVHREGWLAVQEMADWRSRPLRSRWPTLMPGPVGALQAQAWLAARRNWFSLIRLGLALGGLVLPLFIGRYFAGPRAATLCIAMGLLFAIFNYGEQTAALFSADGKRVALAVLAGGRPQQLLFGKWLAGLPLPLAAGLTALAWAWSARFSPVRAAGLAGIALALAFCCLSWIISAAAFDAGCRPSSLEADSRQLAMAFEQVPTRPGGIAGLVGAALLAGVGVWLHASAPVWLTALVVPSVLAVRVGWWRLARLMRTGVEG